MENKMIKVSVIVPVYNGEKHLKECLDSIKAQTLQDIEIICVDDGSTDDSLNILREYEKTDTRFTILTQKNQYAGIARNKGMSVASGEYMIFWDCDDFFDLTALEKMYNKAKTVDADVCVCGTNQFFDDTKQLCPWNSCLEKKRVPKGEWFNLETNPDHILTFANAAPWNKMFRRAFVQDKEIEFQGVRNGNDVFFDVVAICLAEKIVCVFERLITYRRNQGTNLVNTLSRSSLSPINAWIDAAEYLKKQNRFPKKCFPNKAIGSMVYLLRNLLGSEEFYNAFTYLRENGIDKMGMTELSRDDFYNKQDFDYVYNMQHMSPQEFHRYMSYRTYVELQKVGGKKALLEEQKKEAINDNKKLIKRLERYEKSKIKGIYRILKLRREEE